MDCELHDWHDSTPCTKSCGFGSMSGTKTQTRTKKKVQKYGGRCAEVTVRSINCTTNVHCPSKWYFQVLTMAAIFSRCKQVRKISYSVFIVILIVPGGWGNWGTYGICSKTCNGGLKYRSRSCNDPLPAHGGSICSGPSSESALCNSNPCPPGPGDSIITKFD